MLNFTLPCGPPTSYFFLLPASSAIYHLDMIEVFSCCIWAQSP